MLFSDLVELFKSLEKNTSIHFKKQLLKQVINKLDKDEVTSLLYIFDEYLPEKKTLAVGVKFFETQFSNIDNNMGQKIYDEYKTNKIPLDSAMLTVEGIIDVIKIVIKLTGKNSRNQKLHLLHACVSRYNTQDEKSYFKRIILNNLRVGVKSRLFIPILAEYFSIDESILVNNYNKKPGLLSIMETTELKVHTGIKPMLLKNYEQKIFTKVSLQQYGYELKYDGLRCQIHYKDKSYSIFTRNLINITFSLNRFVNNLLSKGEIEETDKNYIIDTQLCGLDFQTVNQIIMRKYINEQTKEDVFNVLLHIFDILYLNDEKLTDKPLHIRKNILYNFCTRHGLDASYTALLPISHQIIENVINGKLHSNYEGIVLKRYDSIYEPNTRNNNWLKLKQESKVGEFLITEAYRGAGILRPYYSSFLLSAYRDNQLVEVGQVGSGFTRGTMKTITQQLLIQANSSVPLSSYKLKTGIVVEVCYQGIQRSKNYNSGYSLRFPRLVKMRFDKTSKQIEDINSWSL